MNYVPLHINTAYSFLSSSVLIDKLILKLKKINIDKCGIADNGTLFSWPSFDEKCNENKISPLFAIDVNIEGNLFTIYASNEEDYKQIIKISEITANRADFSITYDEIKSLSSSLVAVISTESGNIFFNTSIDEINENLKKYVKLFSTLYVGIESYSFNKERVKIIREFLLKYPHDFLAFPHIKYLKTEDAISLKILDCIKKNEHLDFDAEIEESGEYYLKDELEINKDYLENELLNTIIFSNKFDFKINIKRGELLKFNSEVSKTSLASLVNKGLVELKLDHIKEYTERLDYELNIIDKMGYNDYFLIVQDYVNFARKHGILVGPGRGSAAGSLVSYLLNITKVDPLKYDLLFERFLNTERISMPDIDIDFEDSRREEIVTYLKQKYGYDRVANIVTIQTIQAKQSLRDLARVYSLNSRDIDDLCKLLTNNKFSLMQSYKNIEVFRNKINADEYYQKIFKLALKIENCPRQHGLHAAGIILNNNELETSLPIFYDENIKSNITQYEMGFLEKQGFLKMDLLGLTNLSTIQFILQLIKNNRDIDLSFDDIPIDDPIIFDGLINKLMTNGIFQLESAGMNNAIAQVKPTCFNDITAILALFRPGPMANIPIYAERKNKHTKISYIVPELEPILKPTYGIIIYQEQIMQIAQKIASFSLSEADILRKAISKKNASQMESLKAKFIKGAITNNYTNEKAKELYLLIEKFALYGFNKSHSVAYAMISTKMAYLKAKYPEEFYIAILSSVVGTNDAKFKNYLTEMSKRNINISTPSINKSQKIFSINNGKLIMPLSTIKGLMSTITDAILYERTQNGEFKDFYSFIYRMYDYTLTEPTLEKLIKSGCFDEFTTNRAALLAAIKDILRAVSLEKKTKGQCSIFGDNFTYNLDLAEDIMQRSKDENDLLGIMVTNNPLATIKAEYKDIISTPIGEFGDSMNVTLFAFIESKKIITTKSTNKQMAFLTVFDEFNTKIDVTIFPNLYTTSAEIIAKNNIVLIKGHTEVGNRGLQLIADEIKLIKEDKNDEKNYNN
ncbi:MAG: DNA polymerase III subunit alpha [Bacilli bacterium]